MKQFILVVTVLIILAGCQAGPAATDGQSLPGADLDRTTWRMRTMAGEPPLADAEITAGFEGESLSGSTGCNNYFASYTTSGEQFDVPDFAVTEIFCVQPEGVMEQESVFLDHLNQVDRFHLSADQLILFTRDGQELIFAPRE